MGKGEANSICHEVEKRFGVHMPNDLRHFIEGKIIGAGVKAVRDAGKEMEYWEKLEENRRGF